jgi:hypothetical protein
MKKNISLILLLVATLYGKAQVIMVCNPSGNSCTPHNNITNAIAQANNGDYIYLHGGNFSMTYDTIRKELHFVGAGSFEDSSLATGATYITDNIVLEESASNSSFEGLYLVGNVHQNAQNALSNIIFKACNFSSYTSTSGKPTNNSTFINVVVRDGIELNGGANNTFYNSAIRFVSGANYSSFKHCLFFGQDHCFSNSRMSFWNCNNSEFKYNIFFCNIGGSTGYYCGAVNANNIYSHNLARTGMTSYGGAFLETGNLYAIADNLLCESPASTISAFSHSHDYRLVSTSLGKGYGEGGTDCGIYGGSFPWVDGMVPSNPHIYYKNISATTNLSNNLPVNIKVRSGN